MGDYLRRAYDEAERAMSRGDSDATRTRQDVADEIEEAVEAACDRNLPAYYMTEEAYQHLRKRVAELQAENDRLREQIHWLKKGDVLHVLTDHMDSPCEDCPLKGKPACADCPIFAREVAVIDRMPELGVVEVDE